MQNQSNKQNSNISSFAENPEAKAFNNYGSIFSKLEQAIANDVQNIKNLVQQGVISKEQGRNLILQLADKLNKMSANKNDNILEPQKQAVSDTSEEIPNTSTNYLEIFVKDNPEFFKSEARNALFDYIKNLSMDKDEIYQIVKLVELLENAAVDKYMKKIAHEKSLNDENAIAKKKLSAYAQDTNSSNNYDRIFTRGDLGAMDGDEFNKNETLIMEQVKKGLIV